jgi:lactate permease
MLPINIASFTISALPLILLLIAMLAFKMKAPTAGAVALVVALLAGWLYFHMDFGELLISSAKGVSLSLFVLLIIWASVYMYNILQESGSIKSIGNSVSAFSGSRLGQALVIGWMFSGFVQGVTGFGVPVALVAPLLIAAGFEPVTSVVIALIGHSWAVTFGSIGSSYYTIQLVTGISGTTLAPVMAILFAVPIFATGFCVAYIQGGLVSLRRSVLPITITASVVSFLVWLMAYSGMPQLATIVPGLAGCILLSLLSRTRILPSGDYITGRQSSKNGMNFNMAFLSYYLMIALTILTQIPSVKSFLGNIVLGIDYPGFTTGLGYVVEPANKYSGINLATHPAPFILTATLITALVYIRLKLWKKKTAVVALIKTYKQCLSTTLGILTMVIMAIIMIDSGMTETLALGLANVSGPVFPVISPFIGVLGSFLTGSNTNSNIMFGSLQYQTALSLGISTTIIASVQSIGGSVGSALAPAKVLIGASLAGISGREWELMRKVAPYCLFIVLLVGLEAYLAIKLFGT